MGVAHDVFIDFTLAFFRSASPLLITCLLTQVFL
jgi:hypothetical protein